MSGPSLMNFNVGQIKKMLEEYHAALDSSVDEVYNNFALAAKKAIEESGESVSSIAQGSGTHDMTIRNLKTGELGQGVGLKSALRILAHLGYQVEIKVSKRN
jgi:hypothetical protein